MPHAIHLPMTLPSGSGPVMVASIEAATEAVDHAPEALRWSLTRNCSMSPRQTGLAFALLALVSLSVAVGFLMAGVGIVLLFSGLELVALATAWLVWARRVGAGEHVSLEGAVLVVRTGGSSPSVHRLPLGWTQVIEERSRIVLACGSQRIGVGSQASWQRRTDVVRQLRRALASPQTSLS